MHMDLSRLTFITHTASQSSRHRVYLINAARVAKNVNEKFAKVLLCDESVREFLSLSRRTTKINFSLLKEGALCVHTKVGIVRPLAGV